MKIEDEAIRDTYTRIEKALDLRFEADTSLYISKMEVDKVKLYLADKSFTK